MRRDIAILAALLCAFSALPGCLWLTGTVAVVLGTSSSDGGHEPAAEPALPAADELDSRPNGPDILLEDVPVAVALGDFLRGKADSESGASPALDGAVIFEGGQHVTFYEGDGKGRLSKHSTVPLRESYTVALAVVPPSPGGVASLLVAMPRTLEIVSWDETARGFRTAFVELEGRADLVRDVAILDVDGDKALDAAVSSRDNIWVEFFRVSPDRRSLQRGGPNLKLAYPPISLTAADFDRDSKGQSDLAILAERQAEAILLLHLAREGGSYCSEPDASLRNSEPAFSLVRGGDYDRDADGVPDIAFSRSDGTGIVFVRKNPGAPDGPPLDPCDPQNENRKWTLERFPGGGHFSPQPAGIVSLHSPGGLLETWDLVTVDARLNSVIVSAFKEGGDEITKSTSYSLPGKGRALAAGDLDGDAVEDLVAVTAGPATPVLAVLLARSIAPVRLAKKKEENPDYVWSPPDDPFFYPFGSRDGEFPQQAPAVLDMALGRAGPEGREPFLAVIDRDNAELTVFFLDREGNPIEGREERYTNLGSRPGVITVADFDQDEGDDIVVIAQETLHFLWNRGSSEDPGRRFEPEVVQFQDLVDQDPALAGIDFIFVRKRGVVSAFLDGNPFPDLVVEFATTRTEPCMPVPCDSPESPCGPRAVPIDHAIVILNPGSPADQKVKFYQVPEGPRRFAVANLNDDAALDLAITCDGSNLIHLLFGDPTSPGTFFDAPGDRIPPITLCGLRNDFKREEVEDLATNNSPLVARMAKPPPAEEWPAVDWIVSTHESSVQLYRRSGWDPTPGGGKIPIFDRPCLVYQGTDPEGLLVMDLFPDEGHKLDLAVLDEAENKGVVFMKNSGRVGDCNPWEQEGLAVPVGAPQEIGPILDSGGVLKLAVASRTQQEVVILQRGCRPEGCSFSTVNSIRIPRPNIPGGFLGFTSKSLSSGGLAVALGIEDGVFPAGFTSVDVLLFHPESAVTPQDLLNLGESYSLKISKRIEIMAAGNPTALCLGKFSGREAPDLLVYSSEAKDVACHEGRSVPDMPVDPAGKPLLHLDEPLVDWAAFGGGSGPDVLAIATKSRVSLHTVTVDVSSAQATPFWTSNEAKSIQRIAPGWLSPRKDPKRDLFIASLETGRVVVETVDSGGGRGSQAVLLAGAQDLGCLGASDLNGDGLSDLAVVDKGASTLHIFLATSGGVDLFQAKTQVGFPGVAEPVGLVFLEANGDGHTDIAFGAESGEVFVFLGNGAGSFQSPGVLFAAPVLEGLTAHDLDGDGVDEILAATSLPGFIILSGR